jgi:5-methylcytosine-specific restriction protein A
VPGFFIFNPMPQAAKRPCAHPGCGTLTDTGRCAKHAADQYQQRANSTQRMYNYRWQKASKAFLARHPLCVMCTDRGRVTAATIVDHITPHRGDPVLFWDETNWQGLCTHDHNSKKQREERNNAA